MKVSIVVISRNQERFVSEAIESAVRQEPFEIVCMDDASEDGTFTEMGKFHTYNVRVFSMKEQSGPAATRNEAIRLSHGDWIVPLDGDDLLHPHFLAETTWAARIHDTDISYTDIQTFGEIQDVWTMGPLNLHYLLQANRMPCCALYRKKVWAEVQGYDPTTEFYCDWDFWIKAAKKGFTATHVTKPLWGYRRHAQAWTRTKEANDRERLTALIHERHAEVQGLR